MNKQNEINEQDKFERQLEYEDLVSKKSTMPRNPIEANNLRYGRLVIAFAKSPYDSWIFENNNGKFIFTDRSVFFQSDLADKNFERFPFFETIIFILRNILQIMQ